MSLNSTAALAAQQADAERKHQVFARDRDALYRAFDQAQTSVDLTVAPDDEMRNTWDLTPAIYSYGGRSALKVCTDALVSARCAPPKRILDFPSGHGRALRWFRAAYPEAHIFAGDINGPGVEFCESRFGATGFVSPVSFDELDLPGELDLIWVGSLFTHLSEVRAKQLLHKLSASLAQGGLLLFTTHGRVYPRVIQGATPIIDAAIWDTIMRDYYRTGWGYADYPQYAHIQYGLSMTAPGWIFEQIHTRDDLQLVFFGERAWHGQHDVTALQRRSIQAWYDPEFL